MKFTKLKKLRDRRKKRIKSNVKEDYSVKR